ncbi:MAG: hypothetical protein AAF081_08705 [Actinomycetota bacterium]
MGIRFFVSELFDEAEPLLLFGLAFEDLGGCFKCNWRGGVEDGVWKVLERVVGDLVFGDVEGREPEAVELAACFVGGLCVFLFDVRSEVAEVVEASLEVAEVDVGRFDLAVDV